MCLHEQLTVVWGDDRAYWEKCKTLKAKHGSYETTEEGKWEPIDSSWGGKDKTHQWIISIYCDNCGLGIIEDGEVCKDLTTFEQAIAVKVGEMGP